MSRYKAIGVDVASPKEVESIARRAQRIAVAALILSLLILVGYGVGFSVGFGLRFNSIEAQNRHLQMNVDMLNTQILEILLSTGGNVTLMEQGNFSWNFQNNCGNVAFGTNGFVDPTSVQYNVSNVQMGPVNFTLVELAGPPQPEAQFQTDCGPTNYVAFVMGNFVPIYLNPVLGQNLPAPILPLIATVFSSLANPSGFPLTGNNVQAINISNGCIQNGNCLETSTSLPIEGPVLQNLLRYNLSPSSLTIYGFVLWDGSTPMTNIGATTFQLSRSFRLLLPSA